MPLVVYLLLLLVAFHHHNSFQCPLYALHMDSSLLRCLPHMGSLVQALGAQGDDTLEDLACGVLHYLVAFEEEY